MPLTSLSWEVFTQRTGDFRVDHAPASCYTLMQQIGLLAGQENGVPDQPPHIYAAITADIVGSTEYYQRTGEPLRPRLLEALGHVNTHHRDGLVVPFAITLGDEFQGLALPGACPRVIYDLRLALSPLKCRVGVGISTIVSEIAESTSLMEGPAFSLSREALNSAGGRKGRLTVYRADDPAAESAANTVSMLIDIIQSGWTDKQWEAVRLYDELGEQAAVGARLGASRQAAEDRLRRTNRAQIEDALGFLAATLDQLPPR